MGTGATEDAASGRAARPGGTAPVSPSPQRTDRIAVVTGASSGIGAALTRKLTADGYTCVLLARREGPLREVAAEVGGEAEVCDVSNREAVERVARAVLERHPRIALLVNNAGMPARTTFLGDPDRIEEVLRVNYLGSVWCLRAFLPGLEAGRPSDVVNVVSVAGTVAAPSSGPYAASKHAQLAFSRSVQPLLRGRGVRVHTVLPGPVETEGFPQRGRLGNRFLERTIVEPDDVAERIVSMVARRRTESFIPRWYRVLGLTQALAPGLVRLGARRYRWR
jgi:short-subunit dehydrogenase